MPSALAEAIRALTSPQPLLGRRLRWRARRGWLSAVLLGVGIGCAAPVGPPRFVVRASDVNELTTHVLSASERRPETPLAPRVRDEIASWLQSLLSV